MRLWCRARMLPGILSAVSLTIAAADNAQDGLGHLRIDSDLAHSLAQVGCAVHTTANAAAPFAETLHLPAGRYRKVYRTSTRTRYFAIVGDDCDYVANPAAPTVRMVATHRMDSGFLYVALFNASGDVLAMLEETPGTPPRYAPVKERDIGAIFGDLKSEVQSWNTALLKLLQQQSQQDGQPGTSPR